MASGPEIYVGNKGTQRARDAQAYYSHCYAEAIVKLRQKTFKSSERGVPLECFTWERVVVDECHETLVTGKNQETQDKDFKGKAARGAREFLGVAETDITKRPLLASRAIWGLTGTPLLETEARVTELANLMGGTYLTGAEHHWRKDERDSGRDRFLNQHEAVFSRECRCAVQESCHSYVTEACQRNCGEELQVVLTKRIIDVRMSESDRAAFLKQADESDSVNITLNQLDNRSNVLKVTAASAVRHKALLDSIDTILEAEPDTKVVVFANTAYDGCDSAKNALEKSDLKFCHVSDEDAVKKTNEVIAWFRHGDLTAEEKARPRVLLLSFDQAAGHNLQEACHNVIMYDPYYSGSDAVADASVEEQAIGRVYRQGQQEDVTVTRIVLRGPNGERSVADWIVDRNQDERNLAAATSNFD